MTPRRDPSSPTRPECRRRELRPEAGGVATAEPEVELGHRFSRAWQVDALGKPRLEHPAIERDEQAPAKAHPRCRVRAGAIGGERAQVAARIRRLRASRAARDLRVAFLRTPGAAAFWPRLGWRARARGTTAAPDGRDGRCPGPSTRGDQRDVGLVGVAHEAHGQAHPQRGPTSGMKYSSRPPLRNSGFGMP